MFKKNTRHQQLPLTSHVDELPEKLRKRLENSWGGVFYREIYRQIDEAPFRGRKSAPDKAHLADFEIQFGTSGKPSQVTCPAGQRVSVQASPELSDADHASLVI